MVVEEKTGKQILNEKFSPIFMRYVPKAVAEEFRKFSKENAEGHYGVALKMLLDDRKWRKELAVLSARIEALETKPEDSSTSRKTVKTFGVIKNE